MTPPRNLRLDGCDADFDAQLALALPPARCFEVAVTLPDGTRALALRTGGTSLQHAEAAMASAGLGAKVSVRALPHPFDAPEPRAFQVKPL